MALTATILPFSIQLSDVDRGVYESPELRVAQHPSETAAFMLTRVLAYCLEYTEGIVLTDGIAAVDEPAVLVRDLTGQLQAWIEVGAPDPERIHRAAKRAPRMAIYTHRDTAPLLALYAGHKLHRAAEIPLYSFGRGFIDTVTPALQRRNTMTLSVTDRAMYLDLNGQSFETEIVEQRLAQD